MWIEPPALPLLLLVVPHTTDHTTCRAVFVSLQQVAAGRAPIMMLYTVLLLVREIYASHEHRAMQQEPVDARDANDSIVHTNSSTHML